MHPEDLASLVKTFSDLHQDAASCHVFRVVRPDGGVRWVEGRTSVIWGAKGRVLRLAGTATDITERIM
ncbi:PAS domain-containing protein [Cupriavidus sp. D39]|uniref:PAS domain-containing protein n=1 Tax=Cupriavidus sp. D39 TaxID=2997877 RepID=UPI003B63DE3E